MPSLTRKEVEEIALLARLHMDEAALARMESELGAILEHFSSIAAVDTTDIPPMTHAVPIELPLRVDVAFPSLDAADALRAVPKRDGDLIVVPAIIAGSGE
ncbi:MAG: Asp-tRNA(Asn)/Glu-tRNA(Gln) amidotransferase subunit GatC [Deltaproteobacteria bacterium]|nr:Asp-tRNA(Asn)/Glu-tRNA(Gln) amidotransferase subunit GatC [Deltaproteobacteria bacterium]